MSAYAMGIPFGNKVENGETAKMRKKFKSVSPSMSKFQTALTPLINMHSMRPILVSFNAELNSTHFDPTK